MRIGNMRERKCISDSILELYELGELPDEEMAIVNEAIDKDEGLRMRHKTIRDSINRVINNDSWEDVSYFLQKFQTLDAQSSIANEMAYIPDNNFVYICISATILLHIPYIFKSQTSRGDDNEGGSLPKITDDEIGKYEGKNDFDSLIKLASLYINRNDLKDDIKALEKSEQALKISPNDPQALCIRGLAYFEIGDFEKALNDLKAALEKDKDKAIKNPEAVYYAIGKIHYRAKERKDALEFFEKIIAINSDYADVNRILVEIENQITGKT